MCGRKSTKNKSISPTSNRKNIIYCCYLSKELSIIVSIIDILLKMM